MTEAEWLSGADPKAMLKFISTRANVRKLRLFAVASCWRASEYKGTEVERAVEIAERMADGLAEPQEASDFLQKEIDYRFPPGRMFRSLACMTFLKASGDEAALMAFIVATDFPRTTALEEVPFQVALMRDVFGNPFRPIIFSASWRTDTAVALASQMYESRDFSALPILADALQDAGCDSKDVLDHCRQPGSHVRGCWIVDSVLGKS